MSRKARRQFDSKFKTKVVIEALRERKTLSELCKEFELHPNQISDWKKQVLGALPSLFEKDNAGKKSQEIDIEEITSPLYQQIGQLKVEVDFLKKKCGNPK